MHGIDPEKGVGMPLWESAQQLDYVARKRLSRLSMGSTTSIGYSSDEEAKQVERVIQQTAENLHIGVRAVRGNRDVTRGSGEPVGYVKVERVARRGRPASRDIAS